ncbi:MFS transporter [Actinomadura graeca]|uniref:MFS transporter n=1 Tax=Actinomadura graeca TaxID=2750812 RepID=A0ABX8QXG0_9ACTN|nr:MFS transporter [Actinomadura graeca]QXJ23383.1 MFS transporter [Actinomadura graeca]
MAATRQRLILAVLVVSPIVIWMDNTILNTAFVRLADPDRGLGASPGELQWAVGSYTLVFATLMFTAGALGDRFGHRTVLLSGMVVFGLSSVWAAYAGSAAELIAARAVMGLGSALAVPATMAILTWAFTGPARASAFGAFSISAGVGIAAGPVLAGVLLDRFWWGSVFLVNVPVVVLALAAIGWVVPNFRSQEPRRLDVAGLLLSTAGLSTLVYGLIRAGQVSAWARWDVVLPATAGLVLLAAFVAVEARVRQPGFDPRLLARRVFGGGNAALGLLFLAMTASTFFGAFYLQGARGFSPLAAGLAGPLPAAIGVMLGAPLATRLVARSSVRPVTVTGLATAALVMGAWSLFGLHTPLIWAEILSFVQGLAIGTVIAPVSTAVMSTIPLDRAGAGSAVNNTIRQTGSVLGIAVGGTIMSIVYRRGIEDALAGTSGPVRDQARISAEQARHAASAARRPDLAEAADRAFMHAMHVTSLWTMAIALGGALVLVAAFRPSRAGDPVTVPEQEREEPTPDRV